MKLEKAKQKLFNLSAVSDVCCLNRLKYTKRISKEASFSNSLYFSYISKALIFINISQIKSTLISSLAQTLIPLFRKWNCHVVFTFTTQPCPKTHPVKPGTHIRIF